MERFKGKYRIESNRLHGWDYASDGLYFITIVTAGRECVFGHIENDNMMLSDFGVIAHDEWHASFEIRQELHLDEFILMPNHLHAIIRLENKSTNHQRFYCSGGRDARPCVSTTQKNQKTLQTPLNPQSQTPTANKNNSNFQRKPKSISSFVAGYKSAVLNKIDDYIDENNLNLDKYNRNNPFWQQNYHDHIIRDDASYQRIKNYIRNNPQNWEDDKFNNQNSAN